MKKIIPLSAVLLALTGLLTGGPAAHAETPPAPAVQEHHIYIHITPSTEGIQVTVHDGAAPVAEPSAGEATEVETPVAEPEPEAEPVDVEPATEPEDTEPEAEPEAMDEPDQDEPAAGAEISLTPPGPTADQSALMPVTICRVAHGPSLLLEEPAAARPPMGLLLFIFVLAIFLGFELIAKVPSQLHTPLMSGSNAISGITIVGALAAAGLGVGGAFGTLLGTLAVAFAAINVVGGYMVTNRMLAMFKKKDGGAQ